MVSKELRAPVAYESVNGLVLFTANVAGRNVSALLDTGATSTLIDIGLVRSLDVALDPQSKPFKTTEGAIQAQAVSGEITFVIPGQIEATHSALVATDMTAASKGAARKIEFVLGMDFLRGFVFIIDPARNTFQMAPSGAFKPPPGAVEIPVQGQRPPKLEIAIGEEKVLVVLDTGAMGELTLSPTAWARVIPKDAKTGMSISMGAEGKSQASRSSLLPSVQIGSLGLSDVQVRESKSLTDSDGRLGMGLLGKFRLALDAGAGKMWLGAVPPPK